MTRPIDGSGDPFEYNDDTVAAKLSVELPQGTAEALATVVEATSELRTNLQAIAKAQSDYAEYMRQIPELMRAADDAGRTYFATAQAALVPSGAAAVGEPRQRTSSENDSKAGSPGWEPGTPGSGSAEFASQLDELRRDNPRQYANLVAQQAYSEGGRLVWEGGSDQELPEPPRRRRSSGGAGTGPSSSDSGSAPSGSSGSSPTGGGGSGPGRGPASSPSQDRDWLQYAEDFQNRTSGFASSVFRHTRAGGNESGFQLLGAAAGGLRSSATRAESYLEQRATRAEEELARLQSLTGEDSVSAEELAIAAHTANRARALTGLAGTAVRGAGIAGVAVGGAMAVQQAGEWYQGLNVQGMERGGGFSEGLGFEMGVRTMAMNPFISTEQSRKIMQTALSEGYTGREFDTVTEFMAENLRQLNIDAAQSAQILRNNVVLGGQSMESAQWDVRTAQQLAANPNAVRGATEFIQSWQRGTQSLIEQGGEGQASSQLSLLATSLFSENRQLEGLGDEIIGALTSNPIAQMETARDLGYQGLASGVVDWATAQDDGGEAAIRSRMASLNDIATRLLPMYQQENTKEHAVIGFLQQASREGMNLTRLQAEEIFQQVGSGSFLTEFDAGVERRREAATGGEITERSLGEEAGSFLSGIGNTLKAGGNALFQGWHTLWGNEEAADRSSEARSNAWARGRAGFEMAGSPGDALYSNERIDQLVQDAGGPQNLRLRTESGEEIDFDMTNEQLMKDFRAGKAEVSVEGGDWTTLENYSYAQNVKESTANTNGGTFDLTPDARRLLTLIPADGRTTTQHGNDTGTTGYARNNPAPGEGYGGGG